MDEFLDQIGSHSSTGVEIGSCNGITAMVRNRSGWHDFNDTWRFDGLTETWSRLSPLSNVSIPLRNYFSAATLVNCNSSCSCKESMIIFGGETKAGVPKDDRLMELHCIDDSKSPPIFEWRDLKPQSNGSGYPKARQFHQMISAYNDTVMYMNGGLGDLNTSERDRFPEMWKYTLVDNKWTLLDNYIRGRRWYSRLALSVTTGVYLPPHTFLMMNDGLLLAYDLSKRQWLRVSSLTRHPLVPSTISRMTHGAVVISNVVIAYGMFPGPADQQSASTVWNISVVGSLNVGNHLVVAWSANPQPRPAPPPLEEGSASSVYS